MLSICVLAIVINNGSAILAELNGLRPLLGVDGVTSLGSSINAADLALEELHVEHSQTTVELNGSDSSNGSSSEVIGVCQPALLQSDTALAQKQEQFDTASVRYAESVALRASHEDCLPSETWQND